MTNAIRYGVVSNTTGAAIITASVTNLSAGNDYALMAVKRTLAAADVGANAGQTRNAGGLFVVNFTGKFIKDVMAFNVYRPLPTAAQIGGKVLNIPLTGYVMSNANPPVAPTNLNQSIGWTWCISADGLSLILRDSASNADGQLIAGDIINALLVTGNY